jgi:hypothetical protein
MDHVGLPIRDEVAECKPSRHAAEMREAPGIVGPSGAPMIMVEVTLTPEQGGAVNQP